MVRPKETELKNQHRTLVCYTYIVFLIWITTRCNATISDTNENSTNNTVDCVRIINFSLPVVCVCVCFVFSLNAIHKVISFNLHNYTIETIKSQVKNMAKGT